MKKVIHLICAARPNFMKIAPLFHALKNETWCTAKIIHTGQHYDPLLSDIFFKDFSIPAPDHFLNIGSGSHAEQTGYTMIAYEKLCKKDFPDLCLVVGDVNATLACALTAKKMHIPVVHVEAGLRSFDLTMPEEINRVIVDRISDLHFTPSKDADENLLEEGISCKKIKFVGNVMIDTLESMMGEIKTSDIHTRLNLSKQHYAVLTLHRPVNVDSDENLRKILETLKEISNVQFIFPVHPRTLNKLEKIKIVAPNIHMVEPLSYIDFIRLVMDAHFVVTDSGGIQEETSYLGVPCFTLRSNTERPITVSLGTNRLTNLQNLHEFLHATDFYSRKKTNIPLWDGKAAERIVLHIKEFLVTQ